MSYAKKSIVERRNNTCQDKEKSRSMASLGVCEEQAGHSAFQGT